VGIPVTKEIAVKAAVVFNVGIDSSRKAVGVDAITVGIVELFITRVVYQQCI
jgi:hypothetical protein